MTETETGAPMTPTYTIQRAARPPEKNGDWEGPIWRTADTITVGNFRPEGGDHRPLTRAKLLYDDVAIYGIFHVKDKYVRCVQTDYQAYVSKDSCVEFFIQPKADHGYLNFEMNCGGNILLYYITDHRRTPTGFRVYEPVPWEDGGRVVTYHSMPRIVEPEIAAETEWVLEFTVPFSLLAKYVGELEERRGAEWRGNFFKCGDETSHPHWASWAPVDELNFHLPRCFAPITFAR